MRTYEQWLYVIGEPGSPIVKIGIAEQPSKRLQDLRNPRNLTICPPGVNRRKLTVLYKRLGGRPLERALHTKFWSRRVLGEWFDLGPVAASLIRSTAHDLFPVDESSAIPPPVEELPALLDPMLRWRKRSRDMVKGRWFYPRPVPLCSPRLLVYKLERAAGIEAK